LLEQVDIAEHAKKLPTALSGGQQQRLAIARAMANDPAILVADEPTGSLDDRTGREVMDLLLSLTREEGGALLYVTHSRELAARADRMWRLVDGRLQAGDAA